MIQPTALVSPLATSVLALTPPGTGDGAAFVLPDALAPGLPVPGQAPAAPGNALPFTVAGATDGTLPVAAVLASSIPAAIAARPETGVSPTSQPLPLTAGVTELLLALPIAEAPEPKPVPQDATIPPQPVFPPRSSAPAPARMQRAPAQASTAKPAGADADVEVAQDIEPHLEVTIAAPLPLPAAPNVALPAAGAHPGADPLMAAPIDTIADEPASEDAQANPSVPGPQGNSIVAKTRDSLVDASSSATDLPAASHHTKNAPRHVDAPGRDATHTQPVRARARIDVPIDVSAASADASAAPPATDGIVEVNAEPQAPAVEPAMAGATQTPLPDVAAEQMPLPSPDEPVGEASQRRSTTIARAFADGGNEGPTSQPVGSAPLPSGTPTAAARQETTAPVAAQLEAGARFNGDARADAAIPEAAPTPRTLDADRARQSTAVSPDPAWDALAIAGEEPRPTPRADTAAPPQATATPLVRSEPVPAPAPAADPGAFAAGPGTAAGAPTGPADALRRSSIWAEAPAARSSQSGALPDVSPPVTRTVAVDGLAQPIATAPAAIAQAPAQLSAPLPVASASATEAAASIAGRSPVAEPVRTAARPAPATPLRLALPPSEAPALVAGASAPAFRLFAAAMHAARSDERQAVPAGPATQLAPAAPVHAAPAVADAHGSALDMADQRWPQAMVERIETLREAASAAKDAASTSIRLVPDALGAIDVKVQTEGDTVHVHFAAEQAATRTLIAEAQPRLTEIAEARGLKLSQGSVDSGAGQQSQRQPERTAAPLPAAPRSAVRDDAPDITTTRIA